MDACTARACGPLVRVLEYGLPLLVAGGRLVVATTGRAHRRAGDLSRALGELGGAPACRSFPYYLPDGRAGDLVHVVFDKVGHTPDKYPRRPPTIVKKPLS